MIIYRLRIILDTKEDVFRDVEVEYVISLEQLHEIILESFGLRGLEMASFYKSNNQWEQGDEIPLIPMEDHIKPMKDIKISKVLSDPKDKLIYVYDYFNLWTFFIELVSTVVPEKEKRYPFLLLSRGVLPDNPPKKIFETDKEAQDHFEDLSDYDGDSILDYSEEDY